jgi:hypothetical protein
MYPRKVAFKSCLIIYRIYNWYFIMTNEKLPISLPKFDKIAFFLNNLEQSKQQNETEAFRQRSNSCSLRRDKGLQHYRTVEKVELHKISDQIKSSRLMKMKKESPATGFIPIDGHHKCRKYRPNKEITKEKGAKTFKEECPKNPGIKEIGSASKNSELKQTYSKGSEKHNKAVKITPDATKNECVSNMFYSIVPICHDRNKCKKRSSSLNGQQELLSTVLQINPDARQNISLVRHGSLPPLK